MANEVAVYSVGASLITPAYRELNAELHRRNPLYGANGKQYAGEIRRIAQAIGAAEVLDYGCGKQTLKAALPELTVRGYDPAFPELSEPPLPADLVICCDVLEHIEPECLQAVLDDLKRVTRRVGYFMVHVGEAKKTLADGRNAHLINKPMEWWLPHIWNRFWIRTLENIPNGFYVIVKAKV